MVCPQQVSQFLLARYYVSLKHATLSELYTATRPDNQPARRHAALRSLWDAVTPFACEDDAYDFGLFCREVLRQARAEKFVELATLASYYEDVAMDTANDLAYGKAAPYVQTRDQLRADATRD